MLDIAMMGYHSSGPIFEVWRNTGFQFVNLNAMLPGYWAGSAVLSNYWPNSTWLQMTSPAKLNDGLFQFALTNASAWDFSVLVSTNLIDWDFLGPAFPVYQFLDSASTNGPQRYYRLRWP